MNAEDLVKKTEVTIIGGGIAGCSLAHCLAKRGMTNVVLVERKELASESSGANFASVMTQMFPPRPALIPLANATLEVLPHLGEELGVDIEYRTPRLTKVHEEGYDIFKGFLEEINKVGLAEFRMIGEEEIRKREPHINMPPYAFVDERGGQVNPIYLTTALGDKARELGVKVYENTEVIDITTERNRVKSVITSRGEIETRYVVNACGAWSPRIGEMVGLKIPIEPLKCQVIVTEELPETYMFSGSIGDSIYLLADMGHSEEGGMNVFCITKQMKKGEMILGISEEPGTDKWVTYEAIKGIAIKAINEIPRLKKDHVHIVSSFGNLYAVTPDRHVILGPVEGLDGFIMDCGFNDYGIGHGYGAGQYLTDLIIKGEKEFPIEELRFSRFNTDSF
jgi:glycine/D-amino acid oxidase-like deaminating enzyme